MVLILPLSPLSSVRLVFIKSSKSKQEPLTRVVVEEGSLPPVLSWPSLSAFAPQPLPTSRFPLSPLNRSEVCERALWRWRGQHLVLTSPVR